MGAPHSSLHQLMAFYGLLVLGDYIHILFDLYRGIHTYANICLYSIWFPSWPHKVSVGIIHGEVDTDPWSQHLSESWGGRGGGGHGLGKSSQPSGAVKREEPPPWGRPSPLAGPGCLFSLQGPGSELVQLLVLLVLPPLPGLLLLLVWCQDLAQRSGSALCPRAPRAECGLGTEAALSLSAGAPCSGSRVHQGAAVAGPPSRWLPAPAHGGLGAARTAIPRGKAQCGSAGALESCPGSRGTLTGWFPPPVGCAVWPLPASSTSLTRHSPGLQPPGLL